MIYNWGGNFDDLHILPVTSQKDDKLANCGKSTNEYSANDQHEEDDLN